MFLIYSRGFLRYAINARCFQNSLKPNASMQKDREAVRQNAWQPAKLDPRREGSAGAGAVMDFFAMTVRFLLKND